MIYAKTSPSFFKPWFRFCVAVKVDILKHPLLNEILKFHLHPLSITFDVLENHFHKNVVFQCYVTRL